MENKYYIPKIEEFCINFRFELAQRHADFIKKTFNTPSEFGFDDIEDLIKLSRVKYLDSDDIKELGWVLESCGDYYYKGKDYTTILPGYSYEDYIRLDVNANVIHIGACGQTLFHGTTKNYNELKKVMEMLNIKKDEM